MQMPKVLDCNATECAYNMGNLCHAMAITIGGGRCPMCDTAMMAAKKGGISDVNGGVGACKVDSCQFNKLLECAVAEGIRVKMHSNHAECGTFKPL